MDIREQVARELFDYEYTVPEDWTWETIRGTAPVSSIKCEKLADLIIPLVRADTLKSISKESKRMDGTIYLVPDYTKFREAIKEAGIRE